MEPMSDQKLFEVIVPPNTLKTKLGGALPQLDADAIARAEKALADLSGEFDAWMADELGALEAAWSNARAHGLNGPSGEKLFHAAHDLKGVGTTYAYPLVTRLAGSLCKLIETEALRASAPKRLVGAMVEAIRVAVRDDVRTDEHPMGRALAEESEAIVAHYLAESES